MSEKWTAADIPDQSGRTAVVTGANSGLGLASAEALAAAGATVVMACRDTGKADVVAAPLRGRHPNATVVVEPLDLADLDSVAAFAERFGAEYGDLDLLINNAGVMAPPRRFTKDGFELQFGVNHLGHFALTGQLLGRMEGREDARVVTVSSTAHRLGRISFDNLEGERRYFRWFAYCQSKLANVLFMAELERRLRAAGSGIKSLAAHPGYAATNLQTAAPPALDQVFLTLGNRLLAQSPEMGALPQLYAATRPNLDGGLFIGPDGFEEARGHPKVVGVAGRGRDAAVADRLWRVSEELTEVEYELGSPVA
jgi:NAD(P)-dependent dehydrogenase (short-subunit alcohol dehydrogenase family)